VPVKTPLGVLMLHWKNRLTLFQVHNAGTMLIPGPLSVAFTSFAAASAAAAVELIGWPAVLVRGNFTGMLEPDAVGRPSLAGGR
jgi:hypothetical protein